MIWKAYPEYLIYFHGRRLNLSVTGPSSLSTSHSNMTFEAIEKADHILNLQWTFCV